MSLNFSDKSTQSSGSQTQNQQQNPWAPTMPYLTNFLQQMQGTFNQGGGASTTPAQNQAFSQLEANAKAGDPNAGAYQGLTTNLLNTQNNWAPTVQNSYQSMKDNLSPIASMDVDPTTSPGMAGVLATIRNDISNNVNQQFAAAGRDLSGANTQTLARGIAQGEAVPLLNQYKQNVAQKSAANQALENAGLSTAQTGEGLDQATAAMREAGVGVGQEALAAKNWGPSQLLNIEQQKRGLPFQNLGMLASMLYPMAGLGGQSFGQGNWNSNSNTMGFGGGFNFLSDERAKENKEAIGAMLDGTPIYKYNYKGDDPENVKVGPMAQDVEKSTPEAVAPVGPGGMKMVNMDLATKKAAEIARGRAGKWTRADIAALAKRG